MAAQTAPVTRRRPNLSISAGDQASVFNSGRSPGNHMLRVLAVTVTGTRAGVQVLARGRRGSPMPISGRQGAASSRRVTEQAWQRGGMSKQRKPRARFGVVRWTSVSGAKNTVCLVSDHLPSTAGARWGVLAASSALGAVPAVPSTIDIRASRCGSAVSCVPPEVRPARGARYSTSPRR